LSALGAKANPHKLAKAAVYYENATVRRLGYLLEQYEHVRQANALEPFARMAKSMDLLEPSVNPLFLKYMKVDHEKNTKWKLVINYLVETDI
jgi:hypothetical protein